MDEDILRADRDAWRERAIALHQAARAYMRVADSFIATRLRDDMEYDSAALELGDLLNERQSAIGQALLAKEAASSQPKDVVCNCDDHDARYCVNRASRISPCRCRCHGASDTAAHSGEATTTGTQPTSLTNTDAQPSLVADRREQAGAVMPLIGPLIDAWDGLPSDVREAFNLESPDLTSALVAIAEAMFDPTASKPSPTAPSP